MQDIDLQKTKPNSQNTGLVEQLFGSKVCVFSAPMLLHGRHKTKRDYTAQALQHI